MDTAAVEQTPSESVATSDDEDQETKVVFCLFSFCLFSLIATIVVRNPGIFLY